MQATNDSEDAKGRVSRRQFMAAAGTTGAVALAGCSSDAQEGLESSSGGGAAGEGETGTGGGSSDGNVLNQEFRNHMWLVPTDAQYNPRNPRSHDREADFALFDPMTIYVPGEDEYRPLLASDWSFSPESATVTLNDEYYWHNGDPVIAEDLIIQLEIGKTFDDFLWNFVDSVEKKDKHTVKLSFTGETNSRIIKESLLGTGLNHPRAQFKEYYKKLTEASSESERKGVKKELTELKITEPIGTGPFKFKEANKQQLVLERFDKHPQADKINWKTYTLPKVASAQKQYAELINNRFDGTTDLFIPPSIIKKISEPTVELNSPNYGEQSFRFNHNDQWFGKQKVRQAFAHILDYGAIASAAGGDRMKPVEIQSDVSPYVVDDYLGSKKSQFTKYGDTEKAEQLLEEVGFTKEGGTWMTPDGDKWTFEMLAPSGSVTWKNGTEAATSQLKAFGIEASFSPVEDSLRVQRITSGEFTVVADAWGSWWNPYPYYAFNENMVNTWMQDNHHYDTKATVPPLGEGNGNAQEVDLEKMMSEIESATSEDAEMAAIQEMAWVFNQDLPMVQLYDRPSQFFMNKEGWEMPAMDDPLMQSKFPCFNLPSLGKIQATK